MSENRSQSALEVDGQEVANFYRTWAYLTGGLLPGATVTGSPCAALWRDIGSPVFVDPETDDAPWWDPLIAASGEFLGVQVTDIEGLDASPVDRAFEQRGRDGAVLGAERMAARELTFRAVLYGSSRRGVEYGRRWLHDRLAAPSPCATRSIRVRTNCPPSDGSDDAEGRYTLYDVALVGAVAPTERPEPVPGCDTADEVEWSMVAADPWLYTDPETILAERLVAPQDFVDDGTGTMDLWDVPGADVTKAGGEFVPGSAEQRFSRIGVSVAGDRTEWRNVAVSARLHVGATATGFRTGVSARWKHDQVPYEETFLTAYIQQAVGGRLQVQRTAYQGSTLVVATTILDVALAGGVVANTDYWVRLIVDRDTVRAEAWSGDPYAPGSAMITATPSWEMADDEAAMFDAGTVGIGRWTRASTGARIDDFRVVELPDTLDAWLGTMPVKHRALAPNTLGRMSPIVTLAAGSRDLVDVAVWPEQLDGPSPVDFPTFDLPRDDASGAAAVSTGARATGVTVTRVPAGATLEVDAARRRATLRDGTIEVDAGHLVRGLDAFDWPYGPGGTVFAVRAVSYASAAPDATVRVDVRSRLR